MAIGRVQFSEIVLREKIYYHVIGIIFIMSSSLGIQYCQGRFKIVLLGGG